MSSFPQLKEAGAHFHVKDKETNSDILSHLSEVTVAHSPVPTSWPPFIKVPLTSDDDGGFLSIGTQTPILGTPIVPWLVAYFWDSY